MPFALAAGQTKLDRVQGESVRWWQSQVCACADPKRKKADKNHALCGGTGIYRLEVDVSKYRAIINNVSTSRQFSDIGQLYSGDLLCSTWPDEIPLANDDWLCVLSRDATGQCLVMRGEDAVDTLPAHLTPLARIESVVGFDGPITTGWQREGDGILWTQGPPPRTQYSVRLRYLPRWQVISQGTVIRRPDPNGRPMPRRVGLTMIPEARPEKAY